MTRGTWTQLGGDWRNATAMAAVGDHLYIADGDMLYRVDTTGAYERLGEEEWRSRFLGGARGALLSLEPTGGLFRIDPATAAWTQLDGDWVDATTFTAAGDTAYAVERHGTLYRIDVPEGTYTPIDGDFAGTTLLVAAGGALITVGTSGTMYRVSPADGSWEPLTEGWLHAAVGAGDDRHLYTVSGETLYEVDARTGGYEPLTDTTWASRAMAVLGGVLYTLEPGGGLYRVEP